MIKKIFLIAWKDTRIRFNSWMEWLFFLILPVIFTVILAGGTGDNGEDRLRLEVVDQAGSPLAAELVAALEHSPAVHPVTVRLEQAENDLSQRRVSAVLVIPAGFNQVELQQGPLALELRQQPNNLNALAAAQAINSALSQINGAAIIANTSLAAAEKIQPFDTPEARQAYYQAAFTAGGAQLASAPARYQASTATVADEIDYDPRANSSAGQLITWAYIPLLAISATFAFERRSGTLPRLMVSPTSKAIYLTGTLLGHTMIALAQMLLLVGFGMWLLKLNWGHSPIALGVILVASVISGAGLGVLLGTLVKTEGQAGSLSWMLGMVMAMLGGCWYPIELFPAFMRTAVKILPTSWAMQGMLNLVLRGQGIEGVLLPAGVLMGFAGIFFVIGVWRFKY